MSRCIPGHIPAGLIRRTRAVAEARVTGLLRWMSAWDATQPHRMRWPPMPAARMGRRQAAGDANGAILQDRIHQRRYDDIHRLLAGQRDATPADTTGHAIDIHGSPLQSLRKGTA